MKKRLAIFLSILIVAFGCIGVGVYLFMESPKSVFTKAVTKSINELLDDSSSILKGIDYNTLSINTKTDVNVVLDKDKYNASVKGNIYYDKTINKVISDLSLLGNNNKIVDFMAVLDSSKLYVKLKDLMENFYYLNVPVDLSTTIEKKDITYLRELVQKVFFDKLDEKDFNKVSEKITLDKEFTTDKISLKISERKTYQVLKAILEKIKSDEEAISIIQKCDKDFKPSDLDLTIEFLDESVAEINDDNYILYSIYVSNNSIIRHEFSMNNSNDNTIKDYKIVINTYNNNAGFKTKELLLNIKENTFLKISSVGNSKTTSTLTITSDVISGNGTITKNDSEENISLNLNMQGMDIGTISFSIKKVSNKEYSLIFNVDAKLLTYSAKITSENKILLNEKITDVDVKNAKDYKTMTEEELNTIMSSIMMNVAKAFPNLMQ